jgi:hypothetical protein
MSRLALILLAVSLASAAEFTSSVSCETLGVTSVGDTSCHTEGTYTGPGTLIFPYQFATAGITENSFDVSGNTLNVREQSTSSVSPLSEATVYDALSAILFTPGPVRAGVIRGFSYISLQLNYQGHLYPVSSFGSDAPPIPILLGQLFPLNVITQTQAVTFDQTDATVITDLHFQFNFFEADGVTPANIFEVGVPEPASFGLLVLSSMVAGFIFRRSHPE